MSQNRRRARVETWWQWAAPPAHHLYALVTLPLHGLQLLICRVSTPAYIAADHHIWWSFPYPPPDRETVRWISAMLNVIKTSGDLVLRWYCRDMRIQSWLIWSHCRRLRLYRLRMVLRTNCLEMLQWFLSSSAAIVDCWCLAKWVLSLLVCLPAVTTGTATCLKLAVWCTDISFVQNTVSACLCFALCRQSDGFQQCLMPPYGRAW